MDNFLDLFNNLLFSWQGGNHLSNEVLLSMDHAPVVRN